MSFPDFLNRLGVIVGSNPQWPTKGASGVVEVLGQDKAPILLVPQVYPFGGLALDKTTAAFIGQVQMFQATQISLISVFLVCHDEKFHMRAALHLQLTIRSLLLNTITGLPILLLAVT